MRNRYCFPVSGTFVNLSRFRGGYSIDCIGVGMRFRGFGWGSRILKQVCQDADHEGTTLWLVICADSDGALNDCELEQWYGRHGFVRSQGSLYYKREPVCGHNMHALRSDTGPVAVVNSRLDFA